MAECGTSRGFVKSQPNLNAGQVYSMTSFLVMEKKYDARYYNFRAALTSFVGLEAKQ